MSLPFFDKCSFSCTQNLNSPVNDKRLWHNRTAPFPGRAVAAGLAGERSRVPAAAVVS